MSDERSFERFVADHVAGTAGDIRIPDDFYDDIHAFASRTRQRPEWFALIKEPPMRIDSTLGVGSPTARVVALAATTLLLAVLSAGALVVGAQSPAPAPPETGAISFFTGTGPTDACQIASPTEETVGDVLQQRGESWGCQVWTMDDPRISGVAKTIWNQDIAPRPTGGSGAVASALFRIENEAGAWEGTMTELEFGSQFRGSAGWFIGEGAYDGLTAFVMDDLDDIWGVIRPDDGFGPPPAFADE